MGTLSEDAPASSFDVSRRFVRVLGEKRGLIEFEFAIGDPDVAVELMLPPEDFRAFCQAQHAVVLDDDTPRAPAFR